MMSSNRPLTARNAGVYLNCYLNSGQTVCVRTENENSNDEGSTLNLLDIIAVFANLSFTESVFPDSYKSAIVTAILKQPNRDDPASCRPILTLTISLNYLSVGFFTRFLSHVCCASHNFSSAQSAYRRNFGPVKR